VGAHCRANGTPARSIALVRNSGQNNSGSWRVPWAGITNGEIEMPEIAGDTDQGIFDAVKKYIEREWRVLPFNRGTGKCFLDNKTAAQFVCTTAEISAKFVGYDVGIGVRESGFVDLDIDCLRAVPFVDWLLPKTATIGRPGKLVSHLLFKRTGQIDTTHFTDIDGKEILAVLPN